MVPLTNIYNTRLTMSHCDLSRTDSSMRVIFNGICFTTPIHRETQIEVLNLSHTHTTERSLLSLHKLSNLHTLYLDHCLTLQQRGRKIFSLLGRKGPISSLRVILSFILMIVT